MPEPRRFPDQGPGGGVVSSARVECVARTAARTFETPKELGGGSAWLVRLHYYPWRVGERGATNERRHRAAE